MIANPVVVSLTGWKDPSCGDLAEAAKDLTAWSGSGCVGSAMVMGAPPDDDTGTVRKPAADDGCSVVVVIVDSDDVADEHSFVIGAVVTSRLFVSSRLSLKKLSGMYLREKLRFLLWSFSKLD